jgi:hypothetical protein
VQFFARRRSIGKRQRRWKRKCLEHAVQYNCGNSMKPVNW